LKPVNTDHDVNKAYEGMSVREHAMSAPEGDAHGDSDDRSRYDVPRLAANYGGCATTGIGDTTHGDGDDKLSRDTDRSTAELIDQNQS
jgi:hypothetical protein